MVELFSQFDFDIWLEIEMKVESLRMDKNFVGQFKLFFFEFLQNFFFSI